MRGACKRAESECRFAHPQESVSSHEDGSVTVCMDAVKGRCAREPCRYFHPPLHLQAQIKAAQTRATAVWLYYLIHLPIKTNKQTTNPLNKTTKQKYPNSKIDQLSYPKTQQKQFTLTELFIVLLFIELIRQQKIEENWKIGYPGKLALNVLFNFWLADVCC